MDNNEEIILDEGWGPDESYDWEKHDEFLKKLDAMIEGGTHGI
jgi:hypothetical protein